MKGFIAAIAAVVALGGLVQAAGLNGSMENAKFKSSVMMDNMKASRNKGLVHFVNKSSSVQGGQVSGAAVAPAKAKAPVQYTAKSADYSARIVPPEPLPNKSYYGPSEPGFFSHMASAVLAPPIVAVATVGACTVAGAAMGGILGGIGGAIVGILGAVVLAPISFLGHLAAGFSQLFRLNF